MSGSTRINFAVLVLLGSIATQAGFANARKQNGNDVHTSSTVPSASSTSQNRVSASDEAANAALWEKAQKMFAQNDFAQASAAAGRITSPALKKSALAMLGQIQAYVAALQDGVTAEGRHDPVAAIQAYAIAAHIKSDGPGDPNGRIARVQQQAAAGELNQEQLAKNQLAQRIQQRRARAAQFVKKGTAQEAAGELQAALATYRSATALDPTNGNAANAFAGLQAKLAQTSPDTAVSPDSAIRAFYAGQYAQAEQQLSSMVSSPGGKYQGVAYFYLGATRYYRAVIEKGEAAATAAQQAGVHEAFHQSHLLGYTPLPRFVSPTLIDLWKRLS